MIICSKDFKELTKSVAENTQRRTKVYKYLFFIDRQMTT